MAKQFFLIYKLYARIVIWVKVIWNNEQKTTNENLEALEVINEGS